MLHCNNGQACFPTRSLPHCKGWVLWSGATYCSRFTVYYFAREYAFLKCKIWVCAVSLDVRRSSCCSGDEGQRMYYVVSPNHSRVSNQERGSTIDGLPTAWLYIVIVSPCSDWARWNIDHIKINKYRFLVSKVKIHLYYRK